MPWIIESLRPAINGNLSANMLLPALEPGHLNVTGTRWPGTGHRVPGGHV